VCFQHPQRCRIGAAPLRNIGGLIDSRSHRKVIVTPLSVELIPIHQTLGLDGSAYARPQCYSLVQIFFHTLFPFILASPPNITLRIGLSDGITRSPFFLSFSSHHPQSCKRNTLALYYFHKYSISHDGESSDQVSEVTPQNNNSLRGHTDGQLWPNIRGTSRYHTAMRTVRKAKFFFFTSIYIISLVLRKHRCLSYAISNVSMHNDIGSCV